MSTLTVLILLLRCAPYIKAHAGALRKPCKDWEFQCDMKEKEKGVYLYQCIPWDWVDDGIADCEPAQEGEKAMDETGLGKGYCNKNKVFVACPEPRDWWRDWSGSKNGNECVMKESICAGEGLLDFINRTSKCRYHKEYKNVHIGEHCEREYNCGTRRTKCDKKGNKETGGIYLMSKCHPKEILCNGVSGDCPGNDQDEVGCTRCYNGKHFCADHEDAYGTVKGKCLAKRVNCNGIQDCLRGMDEICQSPDDCEKEKTFFCEGAKKCVLWQKRCDGVNDCGNGFDEQSCDALFCKNNGTIMGDRYFFCDGKCRSYDIVCNGARDCNDNEDEKHCNAAYCKEHALDLNRPAHQDPADDLYPDDDNDETQTSNDEEFYAAFSRGFYCDRQCKYAKKCDGKNQCSDKSDERGCDPKKICKKYKKGFYCDGKCIKGSKRCDGIQDCEDGTDETDCTEEDCQFDTVYCGDADKMCVIDKHWCAGNEVAKCPKSQADIRRCHEPGFCKDKLYRKELCGGPNPECVSTLNECNNYKDCKNNWDERDEICASIDECTKQGKLQCTRDKTCYSKDAKCDRNIECPDAEDETDCETCGYVTESKCKHRTYGNELCIHRELECNGYSECEDHSDETNSIPTCKKSWHCDDDKTIDNEKLCDGAKDCAEGEDEKNCSEEAKKKRKKDIPTGFAKHPRFESYFLLLMAPGYLLYQNIA